MSHGPLPNLLSVPVTTQIDPKERTKNTLFTGGTPGAANLNGCRNDSARSNGLCGLTQKPPLMHHHHASHQKPYANGKV